MWLLPSPGTLVLNHDVLLASLVSAKKRQTIQLLLGMKAQALWTTSPSFILLLPFFLIQQCRVNRLDYELMQAYGLLLGQKARLCLGNDICLLTFSWKHKSLSLLSRFFFFFPMLKPW